MYQADVLIIGGGPAGMISASAAKSNNPDKRFMLIRKEKQVLIPSAIPYIFGTLDSSNKNIANHDASMLDEGIEIKIDEVVALNTKDKVCETSDGTKISFDKHFLGIQDAFPYPPSMQKQGLINLPVVLRRLLPLQAGAALAVGAEQAPAIRCPSFGALNGHPEAHAKGWRRVL